MGYAQTHRSLQQPVVPIERNGMGHQDHKVIGYFAYNSPTEVICTGEACVISGSYSAMQAYLSEINPEGPSTSQIKKTRFGEIVNGLRLGAAYAFDEEAYQRFYPLAKQIGIAVAEADFAEKRANGLRFLIIQLAQG
jgi:hypothetical protein